MKVHRGFFQTEEDAARAYDRSAINKAARENGKVVTNLDISDYINEIELLRRVSEPALVDAMAHER